MLDEFSLFFLNFFCVFSRGYAKRRNDHCYGQNLQMCHSLNFWYGELGYEFLKELQPFWFLCFAFGKYVVFCLGLLLTRRWKLREAFITVVMYRSKQRGRRGQRIVTVKVRKSDRVYYTWLGYSFLLAWLENLMVFHSLSLLVESKVSLR